MAAARAPRRSVFSVLVLGLALAGPAAYAHPDGPVSDDPTEHTEHDHIAQPEDPATPLAEHDAFTAGIVSSGPTAKVTKNLTVAGHGKRLAPDATTDVWTHEDYAYLGTFNTPCGTGEGFGTGRLVDDRTGPGVLVFDVSNPNNPQYVGNIPSVEGSRINDVKVAELNGVDVLVHSNEPCAGGPGGFEIYDVANPTAPVHLAHVQTDDINVLLREEYGYTDVGVHNNFLFERDGRTFNAVQVEGLFGNFQVFDITDPGNVELVSWFGAEYVEYPDVDWATTTDMDEIIQGAGHLQSGYGHSRNRYLHDHYVTPDGAHAYLANWDAGLLLVDLGDLDGSAATLVSQAIDVENGSLDGEVNSHSVWPTADGSIVVEGEEDFDAIVSDKPLGNFTFGEGDNPIYGVGISPVAGDAFEGAPTGNTVTVRADSVTVDSGPLSPKTYPAAEGSGSQPKLGDGSVTGEAVWLGRACNSDVLLNTDAVDEGDIAVVRRGGCTFAEKLGNAAGLGAAAVVIANNVRDDTPWSGIRIWDYSDPANPVLASTFDTECSADPFHESCDPRGTYSSHNVIVDGTKAYISWYSEGVVVLDVADPYHPVEVARYHESGDEFEASNGGIQDVWGVYKEIGEPWVYASDRNGGLYVLKEYGAGSSNKGRS